MALLAVGVVYAAGPSAWWQLGLGLVGLPAALTAAQLVRLSFTKRVLRQSNHAALCINCAVLTALLVSSATRNATLVSLGASLLLSAVRGYSGCESLAISNWLLRRDDQVGCLLFSPLDRLESRRSDQSHRGRSRHF
ncbi:MAG TPA: hypothetical protein VGL69_02135 [Solirubrobacteraceae bacterium]|jgi:hypothetical protein